MVQYCECSVPTAMSVHSSQSMHSAASRLPVRATDPAPCSGNPSRSPG